MYETGQTNKLTNFTSTCDMDILVVPTIMTFSKYAIPPCRTMASHIIHGDRKVILERVETPTFVLDIVMRTAHQFADGDSGVDVEIIVTDSSCLVKKKSSFFTSHDVTGTVHYVKLWKFELVFRSDW